MTANTQNQASSKHATDEVAWEFTLSSTSSKALHPALEVNSVIHIKVKASVAATPALTVMTSGSCKLSRVRSLRLRIEGLGCNSDRYMLAASAGSLRMMCLLLLQVLFWILARA